MPTYKIERYNPLPKEGQLIGDDVLDEKFNMFINAKNMDECNLLLEGHQALIRKNYIAEHGKDYNWKTRSFLCIRARPLESIWNKIK